MSATAGAMPGSRNLLLASHMGAGSQSFRPSLTAFPGHSRGARWEVELLGLEPAPIWDPGTFKARTLAARPHRQAPLVGLKQVIFKRYKLMCYRAVSLCSAYVMPGVLLGVT